MLATLRNRNFALLWSGGLISLMGDWVLNVGLPIYVFLLTRSVLILSITVLLNALPNILLGSVAGVFVDRWDRKRTVIITNLLLGLSLLPLLLVRAADRVWIVYIVAFVGASIEQFFMPAQSALLPTLVAEAHLVQANSLNSLSSNFARLVGPAIGGIVAAIFGLTGIVLADMASFLIAGLLITFVKIAATSNVQAETSPPDNEIITKASFWRELVDGLRVIRSERTLAVILAMYSILMVGEGVFAVLYPVFVNRILHGGAAQIGQLMSAQAIGGLLGGLLIGWLGRRVMSRWTIGLFGMAFGLTDLAIFNTPAFFPFFWLTAGLFVTAGLVGIAPMTGAQSLLQAKSPEAYRGRVFGVLGMLMGLCALIGTIAAGFLTDHLGLITVLNVQAAGYVCAGLLALSLLPRERKTTSGRASKFDHVTQQSIAEESAG
ncbi:MAG TPA: MFS transporter [Ktedonobacteraceae bacterium]|nr:MFS transporter [Ktedonobacteraceae bacterium]